MAELRAPLIELVQISKRYGGAQALNQANLACAAGRIHAVLGENGAGKSTLIKTMTGVVQPDSGEIRLNGTPVRFPTPRAAQTAGIACIFQELSLMPDLSVADNIGIIDPPRRFGLIDMRAQRRFAEEALARAGAEDIHPLAPVKSLTLSRRQLVEIAKALARRPKVLILDEATSALTAGDVERVFALLKRLRQEGLAIIYISHRMKEITELADDCSVFRNGRHIESFPAGTKSDDAVVQLMIGRDLGHAFPAKPPSGGRHDRPVALEVRRLGWQNRLREVSFALHKGEILGLGGLDGQGQRELLLALFGCCRGLAGEILVEGKPVSLSKPQDAKRPGLGIALIPEDRKTEGLMLPMSVRDNLSFAALDRVSRAGILSPALENAAVQRMFDLLQIKAADADVAVSTLSGGNQQKVVIAKWLLNGPRIILLNDPTRGIDVGTKQEIYALLRRLADDGAAILFYSTDANELIGLCERVAVVYDGAVVAMLEGDGITEHALVSSALNLTRAPEGAHPEPELVA